MVVVPVVLVGVMTVYLLIVSVGLLGGVGQQWWCRIGSWLGQGSFSV